MKRASATIRVDLGASADDPDIVARAVAPDDTAQMTSRLDGPILETRIERASVGGLRSTVDDYVVNLRVATQVAGIASGTSDGDGPGDTDGTSDADEDDASG